MKQVDLSGVRWRKSSYSGSETECVEVARVHGAAALRDTKDREGGTLAFPLAAWQAFLTAQRDVR